jgi:hypothetical protein
MEAARRKNHIELGGVDPASLASDPQSGPTPIDLTNGQVAIKTGLGSA